MIVGKPEQSRKTKQGEPLVQGVAGGYICDKKGIEKTRPF
jgi:hypothetical protein